MKCPKCTKAAVASIQKAAINVAMLFAFCALMRRIEVGFCHRLNVRGLWLGLVGLALIRFRTGIDISFNGICH